MNRRMVLGLAGGATLAPLLPGRAGADDIPLRMATINIDSGAEPHYAQDGGFYKTAGLRLDFQQFNYGQEIAAAVAGGALDIALSNMVAMTAAHAKSLPFVVVCPGALYLAKEPTTLMMVPKTSPIQTARDLVGKTVACNGINGIPHYCTRAWVDKAGADSSTMKFVEMNFAQMMDALGAARVDAACVTEPFITEAKTANRDTVRRFQTATLTAAVWANKNQDKTADILMKYAKLPDATVRTMKRAVFAEEWNSADSQPLVDITAKYGNVPRFPIDDMLFGS